MLARTHRPASVEATLASVIPQGDVAFVVDSLNNLVVSQG